MKASELMRRLKAIVDSGHDVDVLFDTEAVKFDVHLVEVDAVNYEPTEELVVLNWNCSEPHRRI